MSFSHLKDKIRKKTAKIGVIGLGYVGLPLSIAFSKKFTVIGFDIDKNKIKMLRENKSYVSDVENPSIKNAKNFKSTSSEKDLADCDFKIICVPTPLDKNQNPDMSYVIEATNMAARNFQKGQFLILESTVSPGATRGSVAKIISNKKNRVAGIDFGIAFSPERADPNNKNYNVENTPKVVGGINKECTDIAAELYESVINAKIVKVSSCEVAEATKILENTFREVNIGLIYELSLLFEKMNINIWEVIQAASSKPFGFMPFFPGPGIGGHCIPVDPFYLSHEAKKFNFTTKFIELGGELNEAMKLHVIDLTKLAFKKLNKDISKSTIAVLGLSYKKDVGDCRESAAIKILEELSKTKAKIKVFDPYVKRILAGTREFTSEKTAEDALCDADCAIFLVDHTAFSKLKFDKINMRSKAIVDCKNIFDENDTKGYIYYGIGKPAGVMND